MEGEGGTRGKGEGRREGVERIGSVWGWGEWLREGERVKEQEGRERKNVGG